MEQGGEQVFRNIHLAPGICSGNTSSHCHGFWCQQGWTLGRAGAFREADVFATHGGQAHSAGLLRPKAEVAA